MRVLQVSETDLIGGRFAGLALLNAVDARECHMEMAVSRRESDDPRVHRLRFPQHGPFWALNGLCRALSGPLALDGLATPLGWRLLGQPYFRRADLVHLQVIHNRAFFSALTLPALTRRKPTVWTLHDSWPLTGFCTHSFECEAWRTGCRVRCPHPRSGVRVLRDHAARLHWRLKRWSYERSDLTLVVASRWMQDRVRASPLLSRFPLEVIPFGVDLRAFAPRDRRAARERLGLDPDGHVIACRGVALAEDLFKGVRWLLEALQAYEPRRPTTILVAGSAVDFAALAPRYRVVELGWISAADHMADVYAAADVFVMPSLQESFGLMAVESMACGTPVITFEGTAVPDVIRAPRGGLAVPSRDAKALAAAIDRLLSDEPLRASLGRAGRALCEEEYSIERYAARHVALYEAVLSRRGRSGTPSR